MSSEALVYVGFLETGGLVAYVSAAACIAAILLLLLLAVGFIVARRSNFYLPWGVEEVDFNMGSTNFKIKPNHEVINIAHQAWTELQTRKAALPFDENDDVVIEIYNSWYQLFKEYRRLIKSLPANKVRGCNDTKKLVELMVTVLNQCLRPHLTKWQARYRTWHEENKENHVGLTPQELQRNFPDYLALISDLKVVNRHLVLYSESLKALAYGEKNV